MSEKIQIQHFFYVIKQTLGIVFNVFFWLLKKKKKKKKKMINMKLD